MLSEEKGGKRLSHTILPSRLDTLSRSPLTIRRTSFIVYNTMFVSVMIDPGGKEAASHLAEVLAFYGFERVQRACWESLTIGEKELTSLKRDIDKVTDYYDVVRIYQYPVEGVLAVTSLVKKKWRKILVRPPE